MNIISYAIGLNSGGSKEPVLESISITANGTYTPDAGIDGYNSVSVSVPQDGAPTAEELTFTGTDLGDRMFSGKLADVVCSKYFDKISFNNITKINYFGQNMNNHLDFSSKTINFSSDGFSYNGVGSMFTGFSGTALPNVISEKRLPLSEDITHLMDDMNYVRYLPASFDNLDFSLANTSTRWFTTFLSGKSLRAISPAFMSKWYNANTSGFTPMKNLHNLHSLDELVNIPLSNKTGVSTSNQLSEIYALYRIKNFTFETNNGQPYVVSWKNQKIDLTANIGYTSSISSILNYNSGITADKEVSDAATYEALKNNPDWFTQNVNYSRYNHDSAVATINSLPDTSAYLAANGGTNTIKFEGESGKLTDGGAINTLTEEEIAVAVARGWTVSFI